jgi:hypothetical protein
MARIIAGIEVRLWHLCSMTTMGIAALPLPKPFFPGPFE